MLGSTSSAVPTKHQQLQRMVHHSVPTTLLIPSGQAIRSVRKINRTKRIQQISFSDIIWAEDFEYLKDLGFSYDDKTKYMNIGEPLHSEEIFNDIIIPSSKQVFGVSITDNEGAFELPLDTVIDPNQAKELLQHEIELLNRLYHLVEVKFGYVSTWS